METYQNIKRFTPSPSQGLTDEQVALRQQQGLVNRQVSGATKTTKQIICENVFTLFNLFNFAVAVGILLVGAYRNLLFLGVIILNTMIGIVQELRSKREIERLSLISAPHANVVRNGIVQQIKPDEILLDDIIKLKLGNQVCADAVVCEGSVEVDESLLTGEADPVRKQAGDLLYSGSFIVSGSCCAVVKHVGAENYAARITMAAKEYKKSDSVLLGALNKVVQFTGIFVLPLGILLFLVSYLWLGESLREAVVTASAAVLGMLPKGLVLLTSVSLAVGVIKLARKKTLVQELFGIETLSRVDTLCLDKTGTITEGKMVVSAVTELDLARLPASLDVMMASFLAALDDDNATFLALKRHFTSVPVLQAVNTVSFSSARRWSAVNFTNEGSLYIGAPETLLQGCAVSLPAHVSQAAANGSRLLLVGWSPLSVSEELPDLFYPVAVLQLSDPIRADARETLDFFRTQDIAVKIISGDHPLTVSAIAKQAGVRQYDQYIDLSELKSEEQIMKSAAKYTIFGRVTPEQKRILIRALQQAGHTVAMIGDGVNDLLALKDADCSIAMASGSDAARQVSRIVLTESRFSALPAIVMEGRRVVNNITRTASLFLVKTIFSFVLAFAALAFGMTYPLEPIQLTLIGVFAEGIPSFILALEPSDKRVRGHFLKTVFGRAFPTAFIIVFYQILAGKLAPALGISGLELTTLTVYLTGMAWLVLLFSVCRPFNRLRGLVWGGMTVGFFLTAYLFRELFNLGTLSVTGWIVFGILTVCCFPLQWCLQWLIRRFYRWQDRVKNKNKR